MARPTTAGIQTRAQPTGCPPLTNKSPTREASGTPETQLRSDLPSLRDQISGRLRLRLLTKAVVDHSTSVRCFADAEGVEAIWLPPFLHHHPISARSTAKRPPTRRAPIGPWQVMR